MLAALGFVVGENFHPLFGGDIDVPAYLAFQQTPLQTFWPAVVFAIAIPEIFSVFTFENPFGKGGFWTLKDDRVRRPRPRLREFGVYLVLQRHAIAATRRAKGHPITPHRDEKQRGATRRLETRGGLTRVSLRRCPATSAGTPWTCTPRTLLVGLKCIRKN